MGFVRIVPAIFGCYQAGARINCLCLLLSWPTLQWVFLPQMQDEREVLHCFILDYIDYCTVMGWFERKDGCRYDDQSEDGQKQWKKQNLCKSTLRATLPSKMKRLINPNYKTLGLSEEDKSDPLKVIKPLLSALEAVSVFKLSERKWDACFSPKESPLVRGNVEWWSELDIVNMGILKIKHAATGLLLAWWTRLYKES